MRELRDPLPDDEFSQLPLLANVVTIGHGWFNLRWEGNAKPDQTFFASLTGRLTPSSGQVPCLYLAPDRETSFEELYGDRFAEAAKNHVPLVMTKTEADQRVFIATTEAISCNLYDLTQPGAARDIGLDLGTLYYPEVDLARIFAQRLYDHPTDFDGIKYRSRHMDLPCVVLWKTQYSAPVKWVKMDRLIDHATSNATIAPRSFIFSRQLMII